MGQALAVAGGQRYCLKQPLTRTARDRGGGRYGVTVWNGANTLAVVPGTPCQDGCTQLCTWLPGPWTVLVSWPPSQGPSLRTRDGHTVLSPANHSRSTARDAGAQLNKLLVQLCVSCWRRRRFFKCLAENIALRTRKMVLLLL